MTTRSKKYPTRKEVNFESKKGWIVLDQIRTVDKSRIIKTYQFLSDSEIRNIKSILKEAFVD